MGVMRLLGGENRFVWMELAGDPKRLQIGKSTAAGEMAEVSGPSKHVGERFNSLDFHLGAGAASIKGMVVGINPSSKRVDDTSDRVRRFEHLAGIKWVEKG